MPLITHPRWAPSAPSASSVRDDAGSRPDGDLMPVYAIFWLASIGRVVLAAVRNETFGAMTTVALLAVVFLPVLFLAHLRWPRLSRRRGFNSAPADEEKLAPVLKLAAREPADRTAVHRQART
jgi:hypothetical protein